MTNVLSKEHSSTTVSSAANLIEQAMAACRVGNWVRGFELYLEAAAVNSTAVQPASFSNLLKRFFELMKTRPIHTIYSTIGHFRRDKEYDTLFERLTSNYSFEEQPNNRPLTNKVAMVLSASFPHATNGYAVRSHGMAKALLDQGVDLDVITRPGFPRWFAINKTAIADGAIEEIDGVKYRRFTLPPRSSIGIYQELLQTQHRLTRHFVESRPTIVHAASDTFNALPAFLAAKDLNLPFVYEVRGFWEITAVSRDPKFAETAHYRFQRQADSYLLKQADAIITLNDAMTDELVQRGADRQRITVVPNSVDSNVSSHGVSEVRNMREDWGVSSEKTVFGYGGSIVDYEGITVLIEALVRLKEMDIPFHFALAGRGPELMSILRNAGKLGLQDQVTYCGQLKSCDMRAFLKAVDAMVIPRLDVPVCRLVPPLKLLEAVHAGRPVIVSDLPPLTQLANESPAIFTFQAGQSDDLANKLKTLITMPDKKDQYSSDGRNWVEQSRIWPVTTRPIIAIYEQLGIKQIKSSHPH